MSGTRDVDRLQERLRVLAEIAQIADGRVPPDVVARAGATTERAKDRLGHGSARTVVALAGATGSGKSTMFNAIAGRDLATTGVLRPTTATTGAAIFADGTTLETDAARLLEWLDVRRRTVVDDAALDGLVLLDLPDHDSTQLSHREEVERLVRIVDVFVWVVDPQKYADAALHRDYLQRFTGHAEVTLIVLNQIDTLAPDARTAALDDLARIVAADGLPVARGGVVAKVTGKSVGVRVMGASARTGEGVDSLRRELAARVSAQRAFIDRIDADIDWLADDLAGTIHHHVPTSVPEPAVRELGDTLAHAVGVDAVVDAVAEAHRHRGAQAAGWPPTRWIRRLRPDPLRRVGLDRPPHPHEQRTTLPPPSVVATAAVSTAIRRAADAVSAELPEPWRQRLGAAARSHRHDLEEALDRAVASARLPTGRPRWWRAVGVVQIALAAAMVVGLLWLLGIFVVAWFRLPDPPTPEWRGLPVPTVLAVGGGLLGLMLAVIARWATRIGANRRAAVTRKRLSEAAANVGRRLVVGPIDEELAVLARLQALVRRLRG